MVLSIPEGSAFGRILPIIQYYQITVNIKIIMQFMFLSSNHNIFFTEGRAFWNAKHHRRAMALARASDLINQKSIREKARC